MLKQKMKASAHQLDALGRKSLNKGDKNSKTL
jgi:hypothetical protein